MKFDLYRKIFKKVIDFLAAVLLILFLLPLLIFVYLLVYLNLGAPVIFKQKRFGLNGEIFEIYKFKSMKNELDSSGNILQKDERVTPFGEFLRKTSIDELPQLWNIVKGDMSFIGPRPMIVEYKPYFKGDEFSRHDVRPGLSGLAQVSGRNFISWDEKFALDVEYTKKLSFWLDIKIFFKTFAVLFSKNQVQIIEKTLDECRK